MNITNEQILQTLAEKLKSNDLKTAIEDKIDELKEAIREEVGNDLGEYIKEVPNFSNYNQFREELEEQLFDHIKEEISRGYADFNSIENVVDEYNSLLRTHRSAITELQTLQGLLK